MAEQPDVRTLLARLDLANETPRCGARRKSDGGSCLQPAMPNGRCRMHGGKSTGPRTAEGLARSRAANWKHGHYSAEAIAERREARAARRYLQTLTSLAKRGLLDPQELDELLVNGRPASDR